MAAGNATALIQSFREVLQDLDDAESRGKSDQIGAQLSDILNQSPHFRMPLHLGFEQHDWDELVEVFDPPTLRPLLCSRNARWLKRQYLDFQQFAFSRKGFLRNLPTTIVTIWKFIFWNFKSIHSGLATFLKLGFIGILITSIASTFATVWTFRFVWFTTMTAVALLVDLKELSQLLPGPMKDFLGILIRKAVRIDNNILYGKRFQGREWNKQDFEFGDSKRAPSFGQFLWKLPPPSSANKDLQDNNPRVLHEEWSDDTTQHVHAIDFCYSMLREASVRKHSAKLKKDAFRRRKADSLGYTGETEQSGHDMPNAYELNRSASDPVRFDQENEESGAIETILCTERPCQERRKKMHDADLSALNGILENDIDSVSTNASSNRGGRSVGTGTESTTDLNWMDVGAEIGMKLLGSAALQKAMTSHDTTERIINIREKVEDKMKNRPMHLARQKEFERKPGSKEKSLPPVHSMWTSASAAAQSATASPSNTSDSVESRSSNVQVIDQIVITDIESRQKPFVLSSRSSRHRNDSPLNHAQLDSEVLYSSPSFSSCLGDSDHNNTSANDSMRSSITQTTVRKPNRRQILMPGVKIVVPLFPNQPGAKPSKCFNKYQYQMATVVSSKRLAIFKKNELPPQGMRTTNCLSMTVQLDKSFLRDGMFAQMTLRVMDEWPDRYMPKHSKFALGSCVATCFGLGVLVGWRVEDDCHVVRSLWQRRGQGSACAYLQRSAIHSTVEAAVGFEVETCLGPGEVVGYIAAGREYRSGNYLVTMKGTGKHHDQTLELNKRDIISCKSARFIPVIEHLKEAVEYQLQLDNYNDAIEEDEGDPFEPMKGKNWRAISKYSDILWKSFLRATEEDEDFDDGMNEFLASLVNFFDRLDAAPGSLDSRGNDVSSIIITATDSSHSSRSIPLRGEPGFWLMNDILGLFGGKKHGKQEDENIESIEVCVTDGQVELMSKKNFDRVFGVIRTLMRTLSIARAGCIDEPEFKLALSLCYDFLTFVKTIIKVQQKNMSSHSLKIWRRAWDEIISTFGPVKERLEKVGQGIAERMEKQGRRAKVRLLRFVDTVVQDENLLMAMEHGEWKKCGERLEVALVKSKIIDEENREHYHRTAQFIYNHFANIFAKDGNAAARNNEKLAHVGMALQCIAAPRKSLLRLLIQDWVLDTLERLLVRVFDKEEVASRMLSIHATNFHSLRQFRMLKNFTIAGKFWMPLLDAADAEFSFMVSKMPPSAQEYMVPISGLFSLCVVQFHKINEGDWTKDWLDFLLEDEAVNIIHEIDMKLILALESFSRDVKEMMIVLPYYPRYGEIVLARIVESSRSLSLFFSSIEDDILNLVDEVDIDEFLKEASAAVEDPKKLSEFVREKSTIAIERFLVSASLSSTYIITSSMRLTCNPLKRIISRKCPFLLKNETSLMVGCLLVVVQTVVTSHSQTCQSNEKILVAKVCNPSD